jgi:23S rRNA (pseudouridine1915-N3)-methyltransferase
MRLILIAVGQRMPDWAQTAFDDYAKRFPPELKVDVRLVKTQPRHSSDIAGIMAAERTRQQIQFYAPLPATRDWLYFATDASW